MQFIKYNDLEAIVKDDILPKKIVMESLMHRLASVERSKPLPSQSKYLKRVYQYARMFEYKKDFDENGVLFHLATNGGKSEWKNPSLTGSIKLGCSSIEKGKVHHIVDREPNECWTK